MKRQRRTFTKEFKIEIVKSYLNKTTNEKDILMKHSISAPLFERWVNDYIAKHAQKSTSNILPFKERRKNHNSELDLKIKIADLYMQLENMRKDSKRLEAAY